MAGLAGGVLREHHVAAGLAAVVDVEAGPDATGAEDVQQLPQRVGVERDAVEALPGVKVHADRSVEGDRGQFHLVQVEQPGDVPKPSPGCRQHHMPRCLQLGQCPQMGGRGNAVQPPERSVQVGDHQHHRRLGRGSSPGLRRRQRPGRTRHRESWRTRAGGVPDRGPGAGAAAMGPERPW